MLAGSLADNSGDDMSDIDIEIRRDSRCASENVNDAVKIIRKIKKVALADWAKSLLPEKCLISVFLDGYPMFWNVDISCAVRRGTTVNKESLVQDYAGHLLKLWILNAKQLLRGNSDRSTLPILYYRVFGEAEVELSEGCMLARVWGEIPKESLDSRLVNDCDLLLKKEGWRNENDNRASHTNPASAPR